MDIREVEKRVFRKLISNPKSLAANLNKVSVEDFTIPIAREVISALGQNGNSVHFAPNREYFEIILRDRIVDRDKLETAAAQLAQISANPDDQRDLDLLIKELKNNRMCKELSKIISDAVPTIEPGRIEEAYESLLKRMLTLPMSGSLSNGVGSLKDVTADIEDRIGMYFKPAKKKFPCGLKAFDEAIGGFAPGEVIVLTAGTGQGKSSVMLFWTEQFIKAGANVLYVTLEMSYEETMERYHAMVTNTSFKKIRNKTLSEQERIRYAEHLIAHGKTPASAAAFLKECETIVDRLDPKYALEISRKYEDKKQKFFVLDIPKGCSPSRVDREIARLSLDNRIDVCVVDYLNIMEPNFHSKDWVREQGSMAKDVKEVARKNGCILLTGAQMNTSKKEEGAKISTDDLKYARAIGENADWLIGFHRSEQDVAMKQIRLELAKHRFSGAATAAIEVDFERMQFMDLGSADNLPQPEKTAQEHKDEQRQAYFS